MRKLRSLFALAAAALVLSGCIRVDMALEISTTDTVTGSMLVAFDKTSLETAGVTPEQILESQNLFGNGDDTGLSTEDYVDGNMVGKRYSFKDYPLTMFTRDVSSSNTSFRIVREGALLETSGLMDLSQGAEDLDEATRKVLETLESNISITYPGIIRETTGAVNGNTVTWTVKLGDKIDFATTVYSPFNSGEYTPNAPGKAADTTNSTILALALIAIASAAAIFIARRGKYSSQPEPGE
jgi:hypothetical protein